MRTSTRKLSCALLASAIVGGLSIGCGGTEGPTPTPDASIPAGPLFDPTAWVEVTAAEDPFSDRPEDPACGIGGFGPEAGVFEVETRICAYLTATQALPADIPKGTRLSGVMWHLALLADEPSEGHIALQVGDHVVAEARPPIPGSEAVYTVDWMAPEDLPAGTVAFFHVHNHGYNSWRLGPIEAKSP